jgi:hypothetical protein
MVEVRVAEKTRNTDAIRYFLLRALNEKCRRDKRLKGFCRFGTWDSVQGKHWMAPDGFFADWVTRLTYAVFKEYIEGLAASGLIEMYHTADNSVFFEITEKGRSLLLSEGKPAQ